MKPRLIVISGPSGTGKTTVCERLLKEIPKLSHSVSCTTRPARKAEKDGVDYFFIPKEEFKKRIKEGRFLEYAVVFGHYYGTDKENALSLGRHVILNLDVQGAEQVKKNYPDALLIFLMPPSMKELEDRLKKRATDDHEEIAKRLDMAKEEMSHVSDYDYTVINDNLAETVAKVKEIINEECLKR